ncbi:prepilin-type N-terminal cleavage/methylation domain-containing protein [Candidatus Saccharibacteria bacterium]|nr:prepilin-type N-terminal cleavage/methylation domain-containing protein [Candidatus Saccharibacteria bacterium]
MKGRESVKNGFTLIELTLAIAFVSVLLVTISLITQEIVKLYRKGYTIKTVNQVGRDLIEDLTSSVTSSTLKTNSICNNFTSHSDQCKNDNARKTMYVQAYSSDVIDIQSPGASTVQTQVPLYGAFCSGQYSYIWNTGYLYGDSYYKKGSIHNSANQLKTATSGEFVKRTINGQSYRLAKIEDRNNLICRSLFETPSDYNSTIRFPTNFQLSSIFDAGSVPEVTELISGSSSGASADTALAVYDLVVFPPAKVDSTGRLFLSGSFILGTIEGGVNIMSSSDFCQVPSSGYSSFDFSYCAINKFNFSVSTTGTGT